MLNGAPIAKSPLRGATVQAMTLLNENPALTSRELAALVGCPHNTAQIARQRYFAQFPERRPVPPMGKVEQRIRALLAEHPEYTPSQIAHRTHYSLNDVRDWLSRIQAADHASSPPATINTEQRWGLAAL